MSISAQPTQYIAPVPRDWRRTAVQMAAGVAAVLREMSFVEHLEELRRRLICFLVAKLKYAVVGCIVAGVRVDAERPISE